jgi:hypothetical protein
MPVVQRQVDDLQLELNESFQLTLEKDVFVDPNGDNLNYWCPS